MTEAKSIGQMDDIRCEDVMCSLLGIRGLQTSIYWLLAKRQMEIPDIAHSVKRDRTSVQKAVHELIAAGLVSRKRLQTRRGRKYSYQGIVAEKLKERLNQELDTYYHRLKKEIDEIGKKGR